MTLSQACGLVAAEYSMKLIRARKAQAAGEPIEYDVKAYEGSKKGWTVLDATTACMFTRVYNACNETNRAKLDRLPALKAINVCWRVCS